MECLHCSANGSIRAMGKVVLWGKLDLNNVAGQRVAFPLLIERVLRKWQ